MDPYLGEIRMFSGNYAPQGWLNCDGSVLEVADYEDLYALIGNTYGGTASTTFALPDLRGRIPMGQGQGPQLSPRTIGNAGGTETVTLGLANLPAHFHPVMVAPTTATTTIPSSGVYLANTAAPNATYVAPAKQGAQRALASNVLSNSGDGASHNNVMTSFAVTYIICVSGLMPEPQGT